MNGLDAQSRAAVIALNDPDLVVQDLTTDKAALINAVSRIDESDDVDLDAGVRAALGELSADANGGRSRDRAVILLTDGEGSYGVSLTAEAVAEGVRILTLNLGPGDDSILDSIADEVENAASAEGSAEASSGITDEGSAGKDSDGDGLTDCQEAQGAWDERGRLHLTDAQNPDTDGDGLTDGQEVTNDLDSFGASAAARLLHPHPIAAGLRYVVSDPNTDDSDGDGAVDALELDIGSDPYRTDSDDDGLDDFVEVDDLGTDPLEKNTDGDNRDDGWELDHASAGFDPIVYDEEIAKWRYATDFVAGATCPDGVGICEADTVAFLTGSIVGGFFGYKDVLDLIGNVTSLDFVGAGIAAFALLPVAGDAASVVSKGVRFVKRVPARKQVDGLAYLAKADSVPASARMEILDLFDGDSLDTIRGAGVRDEDILALVGSRIDFRSVSRAVAGASRIEKSPRLFPLEKDAQVYLAAKTPGAVLEKSFPCPGCPLRSVLGSRKVDIYDPTSGTAIEVKNGYVLATTTRDEVAKDAALLADPSTPIKSVVWHFFPKQGGSVGPDATLRELLTSNGIPYVIHVP